MIVRDPDARTRKLYGLSSSASSRHKERLFVLESVFGRKNEAIVMQPLRDWLAEYKKETGYVWSGVRESEGWYFGQSGNQSVLSRAVVVVQALWVSVCPNCCALIHSALCSAFAWRPPPL